MFFNPNKEFSIFYEGRRSFLDGENATSTGGNKLEPPMDYKNKRQMKKTAELNSLTKGVGKNDEQFNLVFGKKESNETIADTLVNSSKQSRIKFQLDNSKKKDRKQPHFIILEKYSSTNKEDWVEQRQAGCRIWVNKSTGEVSSECPWIEGGDIETEETSSSSSQERISNEFSACSALYDHSEVKDLFDMLDNYSSGKK